MDNLRKAIQVIFGNTCPDALFSKINSGVMSADSSERSFIENGYETYRNYGFDEIKNVFQKLDEDWFLDPYGQDTSKSFFNLLAHFNKQVLLEDNLEPFVHYEHLLKWRELSYLMGEDLFTCSYFAYMDVRSKRHRSFFAWRPAIFSNNNRLKGVLKEGLAENHFHLKGSGPVFDLSWMALMNNISDHTGAFQALKSDLKLLGHSSNSFKTSKKEIDILVYKAAYIRLKIFEFLKGNVLDLKFNYLCFESNRQESFELIINLQNIQKQIAVAKYLYGYDFAHFSGRSIADYAIPKEMSPQNFDGSFLLVGERYFLYMCFSQIFSNNSNFAPFIDLFHSYLLIKYELRAELIQINQKVGFGNFLKYQDRKEFFFKENSIYETAFISMAINDTYKFNYIKSFEVRISPKHTLSSFEQSLVKYQIQSSKSVISNSSSSTSQVERAFEVRNGEREKHFYTVHFIKKPDQGNNKNELVQRILPRHNKLRFEIKNQARVIMNLRESFSEKAKLIRGIDAASSEFAARPEIFAHSFRYLKDHKYSGRYSHLIEQNSEHRLSCTFHVGEDFYDLVDGLRSIDEAIQFLNLKQGDRLGHALALGITVEDYYNFKGRKLMLPKEVILDNVVWLLAKIRKFGVAICRTEVNRLEKLYEGLFREIYFDSFDNAHKHEHYSHTVFFDAWKLRGDDPYLYLDPKNDVDKVPNVTYWERCRINFFYPKNLNVRKSDSVKFLYSEYHFNPKVKRVGKKISQFTITDDYIKLVREVQNGYMHYLKTLNIGIECNPSSNYSIGTFKRYAKHPIVNFYNLSLECDPEKIKDCPQLFVSINTDDQGIFSTSLENEYALMAIALEKEKDELGNFKYNPTMIYQWLDNIRRMGLEQSFYKT